MPRKSMLLRITLTVGLLLVVTVIAVYVWKIGLPSTTLTPPAINIQVSGTPVPGRGVIQPQRDDLPTATPTADCYTFTSDMEENPPDVWDTYEHLLGDITMVATPTEGLSSWLVRYSNSLGQVYVVKAMPTAYHITQNDHASIYWSFDLQPIATPVATSSVYLIVAMGHGTLGGTPDTSSRPRLRYVMDDQLQLVGQEGEIVAAIVDEVWTHVDVYCDTRPPSSTAVPGEVEVYFALNGTPQPTPTAIGGEHFRCGIWNPNILNGIFLGGLGQRGGRYLIDNLSIGVCRNCPGGYCLTPTPTVTPTPTNTPALTPVPSRTSISATALPTHTPEVATPQSTRTACPGCVTPIPTRTVCPGCVTPLPTRTPCAGAHCLTPVATRTIVP